MSYFKRFLIFVLSALLILTPPMAYATTSVGGWSAVDVITAGATNTINATKTAGGKALKSAVAVAPSAAKVGKHLIKGGGAAALLLAVPQILGEGIDWVLDPANNSVKVTPNDGGMIGGYPVYANLRDHNSTKFVYDRDLETACRKILANAGKSYHHIEGERSSAKCFYTASYDWQIYWITLPQKEVPPTPPYHISIETVAAKVIGNAEAGDPSSQEAVKATALEGFAAGEHDAALDAAATETGTENPPDTENPPKDPDAPAAPFDPAGIISAINALKALLAGILSSITGLSDFFQSEPPAEPTPTDTEVIIDSPLDDFDSDKSYITFTGSCPPNYTASLSIMGNTVPFSFDYAPICTVMSALKPFIVGAGYLSAAYIISGVGRSTSKE